MSLRCAFCNEIIIATAGEDTYTKKHRKCTASLYWFKKKNGDGGIFYAAGKTFADACKVYGLEEADCTITKKI